MKAESSLTRLKSGDFSYKSVAGLTGLPFNCGTFSMARDSDSSLQSPPPSDEDASMKRTFFQVIIPLGLSTVVACTRTDSPSPVAATPVPRLETKVDQAEPQQEQPIKQEHAMLISHSEAPLDSSANSIPQYPSTGVGQWDPYVKSGGTTFEAHLISNSEAELLRAARALRDEGRNDEAITVLNILLAGPNPVDRARSNCRHYACLELAELHQRRGDMQSALNCAILARDQYPFSEFCGLYVAHEHQALEERITLLQQELELGSIRR